MVFNCLTPTIVFQEVPNEISLCFSISGCKVGCKGCHSTELWNENYGIELSNKKFMQWLNKYKNLITCVVFFGGEWQESALIEKLIIAKNFNVKTCLYSGQEHININISQHLTFLKTGAWQAVLGGLDSITSNQIFRNMITGEKLNHLFQTSTNTLTNTLNTKEEHNVAA
ncbi:MAG: anaerobic ribonucleoside-triphosphate reductase activating protein [Alteromonadaceae bacterium]|nr:anaerobic ribonucleoside-triphosphate reductase activating protein [Alteromonadaceae bacterium]